MFENIVFNSDLALSSHHSVLTEMRLECFYSKEILEMWQTASSILLLSLFLLIFKWFWLFLNNYTTSLFWSANIWVALNFQAEENRPMSPDLDWVCTISTAQLGMRVLDSMKPDIPGKVERRRQKYLLPRMWLKPQYSPNTCIYFMVHSCTEFKTDHLLLLHYTLIINYKSYADILNACTSTHLNYIQDACNHAKNSRS